jgi:dihydroorotate dehydrogenase (fumarate)
MFDLTTTYLGLELPTPLIAASSGLTGNLKQIIELEAAGAGAVVLKSLFEEEIVVELDRRINKMHSENYLYPETMEFYEKDDVEDTLTAYLKLIYDSKQKVQIPIIASVNCVSPHNWPYFTKYLQEAGADAIELNIFQLPADNSATGDKYEKNVIDICNAVMKEATIPVSVKISPFFSGLSNMISQISNTGVKGIALFNRFYSPDIDLDSLEIIPAPIYSNPDEYTNTLRWIAIASDKVKCDMTATTGIHNATSVAKMILAGAKAVQIASVLYKNGIPYLSNIKNELGQWMESKGFETPEQFRGKLSYGNTENPAGLLRVQFMKHFASK